MVPENEKKPANIKVWRAFWDGLRRAETSKWCLRQESNLYLPLRRRPFYPLNYGGTTFLAGNP